MFNQLRQHLRHLPHPGDECIRKKDGQPVLTLEPDVSVDEKVHLLWRESGRKTSVDWFYFRQKFRIVRPWLDELERGDVVVRVGEYGASRRLTIVTRVTSEHICLFSGPAEEKFLRSTGNRISSDKSWIEEATPETKAAIQEAEKRSLLVNVIRSSDLSALSTEALEAVTTLVTGRKPDLSPEEFELDECIHTRYPYDCESGCSTRCLECGLGIVHHQSGYDFYFHACDNCGKPDGPKWGNVSVVRETKMNARRGLIIISRAAYLA